MLGLVITLIVVLLAVIIVQISNVTELASKIKGEAVSAKQANDRMAVLCVIFVAGFLIYCVWSAWAYKDVMLGYGPHESASAHGGSLDSLFNVTLFFTGIVFILTQIALFWFSYKYREDKNRKAMFFAHSTKLEIIWTAVPALVMTYLVVQGLVAWNTIMPDVDPDEDYMEIEATGYQFAWDLRYPGPDGKLGERDYTKINPANNTLGQVWTDPKNIDDFLPTELVLPKGKKVRVRITAKDVLHNFYLPHFRVKMDAIPGLPTYFIFTPIKTTEEYREELKKYPEWLEPEDPTDPESPARWEAFEYELACAELCGTGHYSMRRIVKIVEPEEYEAWAASQNSFYLTNIRNTDEDPFKGQMLPVEVNNRNRELSTDFESALGQEDISSQLIRLKNVFFETGSARLKDDSKYELDHLSKLLKGYPTLKFELGGHTDNVGDPNGNQSLSEARASSVMNYLSRKGVSGSNMSAKGYGQNSPVESNDTPEGRQSNRRTELKLISK